MSYKRSNGAAKKQIAMIFENAYLKIVVAALIIICLLLTSPATCQHKEVPKVSK